MPKNDITLPGGDASHVTHWYLLDLVRFLLASIVACHHIASYFPDPSGAAGAVAEMGAKAAVLGFFLVSGYAIAASLSRGTAGYYRRRLLRIYPVYLLALIAGVGLMLATDGFVQMPLGDPVHGNGAVTILGNVLFLQTFAVHPLDFDGPVWSLAVEVSYYAVAPLLLRLPRWCVLAVILVSAVSYALPRHDDYGPAYFVLTRLNALEYAWAWFMGFYLFQERRAVTMAAFAVLAAALIARNSYLNPERLAAVTFLLCLLVLFAAARLPHGGRLPPMAARLCSFLGGVSYPLYLLQFPIFIAAYAFFGLTDPAALLALCLAVSAAAYWLVDVRLRATLSRLARRPGAVRFRNPALPSPS